MKTMDWRELGIDDAILAEPTSDGNRLILWLRGDRDQRFQYWKRITSVVHADVAVDQGLCLTAATSIPARQSKKGVLGSVWTRFVQAGTLRVLTLPDGESVEQCGERQGDVILVWSQDPADVLDEERLKSRWPESKRYERLGRNLFLVSGVNAKPVTRSEVPTTPSAETPPASPRAVAERLLAQARRAGDRPREAMALTDLGVIMLNEGNASGAISHLEEAVALTRQLGDRGRESDVLGNLGMAALAVNQVARAKSIFDQELEYARSTHNLLAEKLNLERAGLAVARTGDHTGAIALFEKALALTRLFKDRQQEANLLWYQGIHHAELGQRDTAIARAEEAIALFKLMGKPQAGWYGAMLQKYRMGLSVDEPRGTAPPGSKAAPSLEDYLGGSTVAQAMAGTTTAEPVKTTQGPGLLRMALSATKAMANFVGSGFKKATPETQRKRLEVCARCEHHTGLRCRVCGCFTNVKSGMLHEDCPIGKWPE